MVDVTGMMRTVAGDGTEAFSGDGGPATSAEFFIPDGVTTDNAGNIYVADTSNARVRILTPISTSGGTQTPSYHPHPAPESNCHSRSDRHLLRNRSTEQRRSFFNGRKTALTSQQRHQATPRHPRSHQDSGSVFKVTVTNPVGSVVSNSAILTVDYAPVISVQPQDQTAVVGQSATFSVTANAVPNPIYQWLISTNGGSSFRSISGATNASYTTPATTTGDNGSIFKVAVSNSISTTTSNPVTLSTVNSNPNVITTFAGNGTVGYSGDGGTATSAEFFHTGRE